MTTLAQYRGDYYSLSGTASSIGRQLGLAGLALIWVFKANTPDKIAIPTELYLPAGLLVIALFLDLLQYAIATGIWGAFARHHELLGAKDDDPIKSPRWFNWPALILFWGKLAVLAIAYFFLLAFIAAHIALV